MHRRKRIGTRCLAATAAVLLALIAAEAPDAQDLLQPLADAMGRAQSGDLPGAIEILEAFCADGDAPAAAFGALGALHLEAGNPQKAIEVLLPLSQHPQPDPAVLYHTGRAAEALGRFTDAVGFYRLSVTSGGFSPAVRALGMLLGRLERSEDSYELLKTWLEANPGDHPARIAAAAGAVDLGLADEAESLIEGLPTDAPAIRLLRGRILLQRDDPWGALGELQPLEEAPPPALERDVRRSLADIWLQVGDPEAAIGQMEAIPPGTPSDTLRLADAYFQAGRTTDAIGALAPLAEPLIGSEPPDDPGLLAMQVLIDYGRYLQSAGDAQRALPFLKLATEIGPYFPAAFEALADGLDASGRPAEATVARERYRTLTAARRPSAVPSGIAVDSDDPVAQDIREALEMAFSGDVDAALERLDQQIVQAPDDPRPAYARSSILFRAARLEEALTAADRALEIAPGRADGLYQRAVVLMALQRLAEAEDMFRSALDVAPEHPAVLSDYAMLLIGTSRSDEAADLLTRLVEQRPDDSRVLAMLGRSLLDAQRFEEAEEPLRRAAGLEPRNAAILIDLASALWEANRPAEAEQWAREVTALAPDSSAGHGLLGDLLLFRGEFLDAAASLEKAGARNREDPALALSLARAWEGAADLAEEAALEETRLKRAETAYRHAADLAPDHAAVAYGLAQVLRRLGRDVEASAQMDRYRELYEQEQRQTRDQGLSVSEPDGHE